MILSADELRALQVFAEGPAPVAALRAHYSRSRAYRLAQQLVAKGALQMDGTARTLTPAGRAALVVAERAAAGTPAAPTLAAVIPHLALAPTPAHQAFLGLGVCARAARLHRLRRSHHPSLIAWGPTARFKTWCGQALVLLCGGSLATDVLYLGVESGRSLLTRKRADGTQVTARGALQSPVVVLDELLRAKPDVRKLLEVYLFGETEVADEEGALRVEAVPVVTLNPRPGKTLEAQLGLDEAMLRRAILFPLERVEIPAARLASGDDLLESLRALGPVPIPAPQAPTLDVRPEVQAWLRAVLAEPDRLAHIDITMLAMLVTAATAWLPPAAALRSVLADFGTLAELSGWLVPAWRDALPTIGTLPAVPTPAAAVGHGEPTADALAFDYAQHLQQVADGLEARGLTPAAGADLLARLARLEQAGFTVAAAEALHAELGGPTRAEDGTGPGRGGPSVAEVVAALAQLARRYGSVARAVAAAEQERTAQQAAVDALRRAQARVRADLQARHWTPAHVHALERCAAVLADLDLTPADLQRLADAVRPLIAATHVAGPLSVKWAAGLCRALETTLGAARGPEGIAQAIAWVTRAVGHGVELREALAWLRDQVAGARAEVEGLRAQITARRAELAELRATAQDLPAHIAAAQRRLSTLTAQTAARAQRLAVADHLIAWLRDAGPASAALRARLGRAVPGEGVSAPLADLTDTLARRQAWAILQSVLAPDFLPRWQLPWLRWQERQQEAARQHALAEAAYAQRRAADPDVVARTDYAQACATVRALVGLVTALQLALAQATAPPGGTAAGPDAEAGS